MFVVFVHNLLISRKGMQHIIQVKNLTKIFKEGVEIKALDGIDLEIKSGEMVAIMGPSGSGKSTLMNIIGLLDRPTAGEVIIDNENVSLKMSDKKQALFRSKKIGFVFQTFNLLPKISAIQNVILPTSYIKEKKELSKKKAEKLLTEVGLKKRINQKPPKLSGGEKQRVAIARALINDPEIILADEPTGNLDSKSGQEIISILKNLNKKGKTIVVITHDEKIAKQCERVVKLLDGKLL